MKRSLSLLLTAALALSLLAGCGPKTPAETSSSAPGTNSSQPEDTSQPSATTILRTGGVCTILSNLSGGD